MRVEETALRVQSQVKESQINKQRVTSKLQEIRNSYKSKKGSIGASSHLLTKLDKQLRHNQKKNSQHVEDVLSKFGKRTITARGTKKHSNMSRTAKPLVARL